MKKMAKIVDEQNKSDKYISRKLCLQNFDKSVAFKAACDLIFHGKESQPSGYTRTTSYI